MSSTAVRIVCSLKGIPCDMEVPGPDGFNQLLVCPMRTHRVCPGRRVPGKDDGQVRFRDRPKPQQQPKGSGGTPCGFRAG